MFKKNSLRFQIFLSMTLLVLVSFAILALVMVSQYKNKRWNITTNVLSIRKTK